MTRKFFLALMIVALALAGCKPVTYYLQQVDKVYGRVTDAATGTPLESVEVSIHGYQYSELTNGLGDYEIEMAEGTWTLDFARDGYTTYSQVVTCGPTAPRQKVDVQLVPVAPPEPWIVGEWVLHKPYAPFTDLATFGSNGKGSLCDDAYGTQLVLAFDWTLNGNALSITAPDGTVVQSWTVTKISNDEFTVAPQSGTSHFYRKFPADNIFTTQDTALSAAATAVTMGIEDMKLYSFTAPAAGVYTVSWSTGSGYYGFHGYLDDQRTVLFEVDGGMPNPTVSLLAGQKIYVIAASGSASTFDLWVLPPG